MKSTLTESQTVRLGPRTFKERGETYRIWATVRHDDSCGNGRNSFAITAEIRRKTEGGHWAGDSWGCLHDEVRRRFPELAHLLRWHLCGTDAPMHYVANTVYMAGDRDCYGLRKGETRPLSRPDGSPIMEWRTDDGLSHYKLPKPTEGAEPIVFWACQAERIGEGKERQFDAARRSAVWPDATDEELSQDREALTDALIVRLTALMEAFQADVEAFGFVW